MKLFPYAHATHPQWQMAAGLALAQVRAQMALHGYASSPTLALLYVTDHYAEHARELLAYLSAELPEITDWSGTVGVGIAANNVEYVDEPALALMLCELPSDQYRVFSGVAPLGSGFAAHTALVHADPRTPDLTELIAELADRTASGYLFGGLAASRSQVIQFALAGDGNLQGQGAASGVFSGGLSGVAFAAGVGLVSRVTQGCLPLARAHQITAVDKNVVLALDGEPALEVVLRELQVTLEQPRQALLALRNTLVGLSQPDTLRSDNPTITRAGIFGNDVLVRHIIGLDTVRSGIAVAEMLDTGMQLAFCQRNMQAARADLMRVCTEIREELEPVALESTLASSAATPDAAAIPVRSIAGAIYVSCAGRGGAHFGGASAELQIIRRALGDVPLIGFFASGEIARNHLYGYTGVLTVFTDESAT